MSTIKDCCTSDVQYFDPDTALTDIAKTMRNDDCGCVFVAKDEKLIGVITDRDIVTRCVAEVHDPFAMTAQQIMTPDVLYCYDTDEPEKVLENMADQAVRRMPVVDKDKRLVGVISFGDLAKACNDKNLAGKAMGQIRDAA